MFPENNAHKSGIIHTCHTTGQINHSIMQNNGLNISNIKYVTQYQQNINKRVTQHLYVNLTFK